MVSCHADGVSHSAVNEQSVCEEGTAYICSKQQPWAANKTFAYGFASVSLSGGADSRFCCACFLLSFEGKLKGKKMLVQYIHTQMRLKANQFNLALPGGGVDNEPIGCTKQWHAPADGWGDRHGGVHTEAQCNNLPKDLQQGCKFRFEFLEGVNDTSISYAQVKCPHEITKITGCDYIE